MSIGGTTPRSRRALVGALVGMMAFTMLVVPPAMASTVLQEAGSRGNYAVPDTTESPGGRCGYGEPNAHGVASFIWMTVKPPVVYARDNTGGRNHQPVEWRFRLQRATTDQGPWTTVGASTWERTRAYDDTPADLHPKKVRHSSTAKAFYRAIMQIRWLRNDAVEGSAALSIDRYSVHWTVGIPSYVFVGSCWNKAD